MARGCWRLSLPFCISIRITLSLSHPISALNQNQWKGVIGYRLAEDTVQFGEVMIATSVPAHC